MRPLRAPSDVGLPVFSEGQTLFRGDRVRFRTGRHEVRWTASSLLHGYADRGRLRLR